MRSRLNEHTSQHVSHVYKHMADHGHEHMHNFIWRIICIERNLNTRLTLEAFYIRENIGELMNGCEGRAILPFLN